MLVVFDRPGLRSVKRARVGGAACLAGPARAGTRQAASYLDVELPPELEPEPDAGPGLTAAGLPDLFASVLFLVSAGLPVDRGVDMEEHAARPIATRVTANNLCMVVDRKTASAPAVWRQRAAAFVLRRHAEDRPVGVRSMGGKGLTRSGRALRPCAVTPQATGA